MTATFSIPTQQPPELLGTVTLSADLVRLALDQLAQSVLLYRPSFDGDRIVDLEIIYCNRAALALPLHKAIVPGAWVSEVFVDHHVALDAAQQAWEGKIPSTYVVVRHGVVHGSFDFVLCVAITTMTAVIDIGQSAADIPIMSDDPIAVGIRALQQPGEPITMTVSVACPDGVETWRASVVAFGGQVVLVAADITEMQDALARVTASDDMLRTVLESLAESVLVFDADGRLTYANRASIELLGDRADTDNYERAYILRDVDGMPLAEHQRPLQRGLRGEIVDDMVLAVERPDLGDDRICRVAVRPIGGADPASPSAVVVSAHDITESTRSVDPLECTRHHPTDVRVRRRR